MATNVTDLYGRYLQLIRDTARRSDVEDAGEADLQRLLAWLDGDCRNLSPAARYQLRRELATQLEQEALRYHDPRKRNVYIAVLKHLEAVE